MVVIVVAVSVATCPRCFHIAATALRLAAVLTVLAFCIVHLVFGFADPLLAFAVIITVKRLYGDGSSQKRENDERRKHCFHFIQHATSWVQKLSYRETIGKLLGELQRHALIAV